MDNGTQTVTFNRNHKGYYSSFTLPGGKGKVYVTNSLFPGGIVPTTLEVSGLVPAQDVQPAADKAAAAAAKAQERAEKARVAAEARVAKAQAAAEKAQKAADAAVARAAKAAGKVPVEGEPATQPEL